LMDQDPPAADEALWKEMADLGWCALLVPEDLGGLDAGLVPVSIVLRELGAPVAPSPLLSSAVLATSLLALAPGRAPAERWLPALAEGGARATVALTGPSGRVHPDLFEVRATAADDGVLLDGAAQYVLDARGAAVLVVGATDDGGDPVLVAV